MSAWAETSRPPASVAGPTWQSSGTIGVTAAPLGSCSCSRPIGAAGDTSPAAAAPQYCQQQPQQYQRQAQQSQQYPQQPQQQGQQYPQQLQQSQQQPQLMQPQLHPRQSQQTQGQCQLPPLQSSQGQQQVQLQQPPHVQQPQLHTSQGQDRTPTLPGPYPVEARGAATMPIEDMQRGVATEPPIATQPLPPAPAAAPGFFRLTIHSLHGSLDRLVATRLYVKVHMTDAESGKWLHKTSGEERPAVLNVSSDGRRPYLRTARHGTRPSPWQPKGGPCQQIQPFATIPAGIAPHQGPSSDRKGLSMSQRAARHTWEESFMVLDGLRPSALLLFEVFGHLEDRTLSMESAGIFIEDVVVGGEKEKDPEEAYTSLGWAFLLINGPALLNGCLRRMRLQLLRYKGLTAEDLLGEDHVGDEERGEAGVDGQLGLPDIFAEYHAAVVAPQQRRHGQPRRTVREDGLLSTMGGYFSRTWSSWTAPSSDNTAAMMPIVLEVSLEPVAVSSDLGHSAARLQRHIADAIVGRSSVATAVDATGDGVAIGGEQDVPDGLLEPHHARQDDEPCVVPTTVLTQLTVGTRGATRLSLSPSGRLLAAAVANRGGSFELDVYDVNTGKLHAQCVAAHDAFVYDLCWHVFRPMREAGSRGPVLHPLLISCSGDCGIRIFEVPEDHRALAGGNRRIQMHTRIYLPSHVYTFSIHPASSVDPHQVVLVCGGHNFGLQLCRVGRIKEQPQGSNERYIAQLPHWQEDIRYEWEGARPDILCVRFSKQLASADNLYATDSKGNVMLFQVRLDASLHSGRGGVRATFVRIYSVRDPLLAPIHGMEVITEEMLQNRRLRRSTLHAVDDWVVLYSRDSTIRLASLQRGVLKVETQMSGLQCWSFPIKGAVSPDGAFLVCGSETGKLHIWSCEDGKLLPAKKQLPEVELAGPILDVVWSPSHHLIACCAYDDEAPPVLIIVGSDVNKREWEQQQQQQQASRLLEHPLVPSTPLPVALQPLPPSSPPPLLDTFQPRPRVPTSQLALPPPTNSQEWANQWLDLDNNSRSALSFTEKRNMKEQILRRLLDEKGAAALEDQFANARNLPGGI